MTIRCSVLDACDIINMDICCNICERLAECEDHCDYACVHGYLCGDETLCNGRLYCVCPHQREDDEAA